MDTITLVYRDAPLRISLELLFRAHGVKQYRLDPAISGMITQTTKAPLGKLGAHFEGAFPGLKLTVNEGTYEVSATHKLRFPLVLELGFLEIDYVRRIAGVALKNGRGVLAILETGDPPDSELKILGLGEQVPDTPHLDGYDWDTTITAITAQGATIREVDGYQKGSTYKRRINHYRYRVIPLTSLKLRSEPRDEHVPRTKTGNHCFVVLRDAPIRLFFEFLFKKVILTNNWIIDQRVSGFMSGEYSGQSMTGIWMRTLLIPLKLLKENNVWIVAPRAATRFPLPPKYAKPDRAEAPVIYGAKRRVSAILENEKSVRWALLETDGKTEGVQVGSKTQDGLRVLAIERTGVVLTNAKLSFEVPLTYLIPAPH
ncbi:hypothetical protein [Armatimonas sp.]|uniref:hypothetical protein n=1 Tax=Armatimonas sp. TaxID=1872638 RepID=UPI00286D1DE6|nr:hypothetical protein [Armatimonas sp.]